MTRRAWTTPRYNAVENLTSRRILAAVIDFVPLFLLYVILADLVGGSTQSGPSGEDGVVIQWNGLPLLAYLTLVCAYFFLFEMKTGGQTPGKKALHLRVVTIDGRPLTAGKVALRTLLRLVDWLPAFYLVGFIATQASPLKQRLGDRAARTIVVRA